MFKKVRKHCFDSVFYLDPHQNVLGLFWTKAHSPSRFLGNLFSSLNVICC